MDLERRKKEWTRDYLEQEIVIKKWTVLLFINQNLQLKKQKQEKLKNKIA